jgi:CDP-diacylglycerol---glycerol-3-phosphate 3-phosphatidyltransferase
LRQETRIGAVSDIVADRLCTIMLGLALITTVPWTLVPVLIFLGQFVIVDTVLSLGFLHWPLLLSPNYFYLVDHPLWVLNWSHPAKATNTSSVILVTALSHSAVAGAAMASAVLVVKIISLVRIQLVRARPLTLPAATAE